MFAEDLTAARTARDRRLLSIALTVLMTGWTMLAVFGGIASATIDAAGSGPGSGQSAHPSSRDTGKPASSHHRTKAAAANTDAKPAARSAKHDATVSAVAATNSARTPRVKIARVPKAVAATTPVSAATAVSAMTPARSPSTPSTPAMPAVPDSSTVAALGEEVHRRSTLAAQLTPGYLVNSVVNSLGSALAGTAAHLNSALAFDVRQVTQWTRQMVGAFFDAGAVVASLVNNIALLGANIVGPAPLWSLPYRALNVVATVAGDISKVFSGTPLNATGSGPFAVHYGVYNVLAYLMPWLAPAGANDSSVTVTDEHPLPIILLNGTGATQAVSWSVGAPALANAGYKVYTFNYGNVSGNPAFPLQANGDIARSAQQLCAEVDRVLAETGASRVILIGHSQGGGILPEYYLNNLGGAAKVSQLIGIAPSNHGSDVDGLVGALSIPIIGTLLRAVVNIAGPAWLQQVLGSSVIQQVYSGGDTRPGVIYDTVTSINDEVVTPYRQQALSGPNVTNVIVQQQDPGFAGGHGNILVNYGVWQTILGMLAANPAAAPQLQTAAVA